MNLLCSKRSWLTAPVVALVGFALILLLWSVTDPCEFIERFDSSTAPFSPVEWMTLPLFGLIIPLVWLCPPQSGSMRRQCIWSILWSVLSIIAIIRETDIHKIAFAQIWPDIANSFSGTVFKMRFLKAGDIPFAPKLFVLAFFIVFFAAAVIPLLKYFVPLFKGFFKFEPVAWSAATFGAVSVFVLTIDRLPANLRDWGVVNLKEPGYEAGLSLCKGLEEGAEMIMASLALLALLQSYLLFAHKGESGR